MHLLPTSIALLLFAHTALADVSTTIVTMTTPPTPTSTSYTSDQDFQNAILAATNFYRSEHNVSAVTWNTTSAKYALDWSSNCNFEHSVSPNLLSNHLTPLCFLNDFWKQGRRLMMNRADQRARTWLQVTRTFLRLWMRGVWKENSIIGGNPGSARGRDISRSWFGVILRVSAVAGRIVRGRIVSLAPFCIVERIEVK
jgi:hypothetical protein